MLAATGCPVRLFVHLSRMGSGAATELLPFRLFGRNAGGIVGGNGPIRIGELEVARDSAAGGADRGGGRVWGLAVNTQTASAAEEVLEVGAVQR